MARPIEFEIDQAKFSAALSAAVSVADKRSNNQPILASVLLQADTGGVHITATDMQVSMREKVDARMVAGGSVCINVRYLLSVVSSLPSKPLRIKGLDNHWISVSVGRSEFKLMGQTASDFPELPDPGARATWSPASAPGMRSLIDKVAFSVSVDEARVNLNGMLLESTGARAIAVSTDGHRLTKYEVDLTLPKLAKSVIIPRRGLSELRKFVDKRGGDVECCIPDGAAGHLFVRDAGAMLSVKLSNVVFPPYEQVIPREVHKTATVDRAEFMSVLKRGIVMAPEKTATVKLALDKNAMTITADNPDLGVAQEEIEVEYSGDEFIAGFNATYFLEALTVMTTAKVLLEFKGDLDPCVMRPVDGPDFLSVVMPMRI
jgi:DNA polymerase-3 subunit beta